MKQTDLDPLIAETVRALERRVRESGDVITADGRVSELCAAALLCRKPRTLATWRTQGIGPAYVPLGVAEGARVSYRLLDLAIWLHELRIEPR